MTKIIYLIALLGCLSFSACDKSEEPDVSREAAIAAKGYYDLLLEEKYDSFVRGYHQPCQLPQKYHQQLLLNAQMFVEQQQEEHKGIVRLNILNATADTTHHVAEVFLQMVYGDSTKEQVLVPMVQEKGIWKMR